MPGFELKKEDLLKGAQAAQAATNLGATVQPGGEVADFDSFLLRANSILQSINQLLENPVVLKLIDKTQNKVQQAGPETHAIQHITPGQAETARKISVPADVIESEPRGEKMTGKILLDTEQLYAYTIQLLEYANGLQVDMKISTLLTLAKSNKKMIMDNLEKWIEKNAKSTG